MAFAFSLPGLWTISCLATCNLLFNISSTTLKVVPEQGHPDFPLPRHFLQLYREDPEAFPGQPSHSTVSWVFPGVHRSACQSHAPSFWRSQLEGANKTTSSVKSRDEIQWLPNQSPSGPWLRQKVLSIKIMNRTSDKGQPCHSPTCTGNRSDLLPAMRTKLLLHSYRDRTALKKGPLIPYSQSISHRMPQGTRSNAFFKSTKHM